MKTTLSRLWIVVVGLNGLTTSLRADAAYSSTQIVELVQTGKAKRHGAQFANQGLGCETFLWEASEDHHIFFMMRDGHSYGEYREEFLKQGRFLAITECYLVADLRASEKLEKIEDLKYIRRHEKFEWVQDVWVASDIAWSFFMRTSRDGDLVPIGDSRSQRIVLGVLSVAFPDDITPIGKLFDVRLDRLNLIPEEMAYGNVNPTVEIFGISNRRCSIWAQWPEDNSKLEIILNEKVETAPGDSWPEPYRLREVARMSVHLENPQNAPFIFEATGNRK